MVEVSAPRAHKVFWSPDEWEGLAERTAQVMGDAPGLSRIAALARAQEEIFQDKKKRRKLKYWCQVASKLDPLLEAARERRKQQKEQRETLAAAASAPPLRTEAEIRAEKLSAWFALSAELFAPLIVQVLQQPAVRAELAQLTASLGPCASLASPQALDTFSTSFSAVRPNVTHRPKILVAGLLASQAREVASDLAALVDFRFWSTDESKDKLRTLAKSCEIAVGVTNFIGHPADATLQSLARQYVRHTGGITRLKDTLRSLLDTPGAPALAH